MVFAMTMKMAGDTLYSKRHCKIGGSGQDLNRLLISDVTDVLVSE